MYGEWACSATVVELFGIPRHRWGTAGEPATANAPVVTLNIREAALHHPEIEHAPARLIASITDAVVTVFGEPV